MTRLPISDFPLLTLADQSSNQNAVRQAIDSGVINFFIEAWTAYAAVELRDKNMLDGVTPVGALDLGGKIFENIEQDYLKEDKKRIAKQNNLEDEKKE